MDSEVDESKHKLVSHFATGLASLFNQSLKSLCKMKIICNGSIFRTVCSNVHNPSFRFFSLFVTNNDTPQPNKKIVSN